MCQCQLMTRIIGTLTIVNNQLHDLLFATLTSENRQIDKQVVAAENMNVSEAMYDLLCGSFIIAETAANETRGLVLFKGVLQCYLLHSLPPDTNSNHHLGDKWKW